MTDYLMNGLSEIKGKSGVDLSSFAAENDGVEEVATVVAAATAFESRPKSSAFPGWYRSPWLRRFSFLRRNEKSFFFS